MATKDNDELTAEELIIVEARARGINHREVGALIHRSERTARRRATEPHVAEAIKRRRADIADDAVAQLGDLLTKAILTIGDGLDEPKAVDRLRSANLVIQSFLRLRDQVEVDAALTEIRDLLKPVSATEPGGHQ